MGILHSGTRRDGDPWGGLEGVTPLPSHPGPQGELGGERGAPGQLCPEERSSEPGVLGIRPVVRLLRGRLGVT